MIKFTYIENMEKFSEAVKKCQGSVLLHLPDHTTCDIKSDPVANQMLKLMPSGYNELCLSFSESRDAAMLMKYMLVAAYA